MKFIILFTILSISINICKADTRTYIENSIKDCMKSESYNVFRDEIKNESITSGIDKSFIFDRETENDLNCRFIYVDLANCIKIALNKNYEIRIEDKYKKENYWLYKNAIFQILPDIYYDYNVKNLEGQYLVGGIVATTTHEVPIQSMLIIEWSTINQGKYFFLRAQTRNLFESSSFNLEFTKEKVIRDTILAYYDVLEKKLEVEVQKRNLYERVEQLRYTKARFEIGIGTLYDVKRAEAELAKAEQDKTETINTLRLRQATLANLMGLDITDAIYPFEINVEKRVLIKPECSIEELYEHALSSREDIKAKEAEINAYRAKRNSNYSDIIPSITFSYQNGYVGTKKAGMSPHNSITMDLRTYLGKNVLMGTITQIKADNETVKAKKLELTNLKRSIKEDILNSYYDSENALRKIAASEAETQAANISAELSLANMKAGEATFIDLISSQNLKVQANINLIKNMITYNKAQTNLLFDVGLLSPKNALRAYNIGYYEE